MKRLYVIGGTMGVGKTTVCRRLARRLPNSAFLDGDWCWDMHPFQVTEETRRMVVDNICFVLNSFLRCSAFESVVFCWVMHRQEILDGILSCLDTAGWQVHAISLVCRPEILRARLEGDIAAGLRAGDVLARSLARLPLYDRLDTRKLDVSGLTPEQAVDQILTISGTPQA